MPIGVLLLSATQVSVPFGSVRVWPGSTSADTLADASGTPAEPHPFCLSSARAHLPLCAPPLFSSKFVFSRHLATSGGSGRYPSCVVSLSGASTRCHGLRDFPLVVWVSLVWLSVPKGTVLSARMGVCFFLVLTFELGMLGCVSEPCDQVTDRALPFMLSLVI